MKDILNVYSISGLFYELYYPDVGAFTCDRLDTNHANPLQRTNALFWADLLSKSNLERLIEHMKEEQQDESRVGNIERAVLANPQLFIGLIEKAVTAIVDQSISEVQMFAYMEQIEIACKLLSKYLYAPFTLSIQDGFQEPTLSAKAMVESINSPSTNPYYEFLQKYVYGVLDEIHPRLVWINGQPKISSLAIASYIKKVTPTAVIAVRFHSSEYFSLNKIDDYLLHNSAVFELVDCILLDDNAETCNQLESIVKSDGTISQCRNLIYINRDTGEISKTKTEKVVYSFDECVSVRPRDTIQRNTYLSPHAVMNLKLNPNTACYWNKCSFCGINKKYKYISNHEVLPITEKVDAIERYIDQGVHYFWFEDEAIPPSELKFFADELLARNIQMEWQVRSRIDVDFSDSLAKELYQSGLREIRFGLESANSRILRLMNKFPEDVDMNLVERIVRIFTTNGIHVHFPMIVGFPTETNNERIETYSFLEYLRDKYAHVSFNINVLMLDVSSELYKRFAEFGISQIAFPCSPFDFLGNMVSFQCPTMDESRESIDFKRNEFMREILYPWMPETAQIKPNIFYRLSETIRNTLVWHSKKIETSLELQKAKKLYTRASTISTWESSEGQWMVYDWTTHNLYLFSSEDFKCFNTITSLSEPEIAQNLFYSALLDKGLLN